MSIKTSIMRMLRDWYLKESGKERISPNDWVLYNQIAYDSQTRTLKVGGLEPEVKVFGVADTGSMDGLMDYGHHVVLTTNFDRNKLAIGDIVAFSYVNLILHRIVEMGEDGKGRWYRTRGDNCIDNDPYLLRQKDMLWLCIAIIY